jgi:hypothetical protein
MWDKALGNLHHGKMILVLMRQELYGIGLDEIHINYRGINATEHK